MNRNDTGDFLRVNLVGNLLDPPPGELSGGPQSIQICGLGPPVHPTNLHRLHCYFG